MKDTIVFALFTISSLLEEPGSNTLKGTLLLQFNLASLWQVASIMENKKNLAFIYGGGGGGVN